MKTLRGLSLLWFLALAAGCGGIEGDDAQEVENAVIGADPLVRETADRCLDEGRPCHVYVGQGATQQCYSGKIVCASATIRFPHCDAAGGSRAYQPGRCLADPEPHLPGGLSPR